MFSAFLILAHLLYSSWNVGNSIARIMYDTCLCNKFHFSTSKTTTICLRAQPSFKNSLFPSFFFLFSRQKYFLLFYKTRIQMRSILCFYFFIISFFSFKKLLLVRMWSVFDQRNGVGGERGQVEFQLCRIQNLVNRDCVGVTHHSAESCGSHFHYFMTSSSSKIWANNWQDCSIKSSVITWNICYELPNKV